MKNSDNHDKQAADLRQRAEGISLKRKMPFSANLETMSPEEIRVMINDLQVHQIELNIQNEELRRAQVELHTTRARYSDLYDFAPVGYCTISESGLILEANLTAATLLGITREALIKKPFTQFILKEDQDIYYLRRKTLFETGISQAFELRVVKK